jgi:Rps23 Pro-64 3,4-dihydroxylase Tpa1-like proline 4-hydroxylase
MMVREAGDLTDEIFISGGVLPVNQEFYDAVIEEFDAHPELGTKYERRREVSAVALGLDHWLHFLMGWVQGKFQLDELVYDFALITEMRPGDSHVKHCDGTQLDGKTPNHTPHRTHTAMVYFNQHGEDFTGGELIVGAGNEDGMLALNPRTLGLGISATRNMLFKVEPTPGLVVAFTNSVPHEVLPVLKGRRFALSCWFQDGRRNDE